MMYLKESQWKIDQSTKARLSYLLQIYFVFIFKCPESVIINVNVTLPRDFQKQGSSDACGELLPVPNVSVEPQKGKDQKEDKSIMSG